MTVPAPVSPAVAAFAAAGSDIDALTSAIGEASYLDTQPGEDRQKLRGVPAFAPLNCAEYISAAGTV